MNNNDKYNKEISSITTTTTTSSSHPSGTTILDDPQKNFESSLKKYSEDSFREYISQVNDFRVALKKFKIQYDEDFKKLKESIKNTEDSLQVNTDNLTEEFKYEINRAQADYIKVSEENKIKTIEILGLFTTLFTFLSVETQLFKSLTSFNQFLSISLVMGGFLILFILLMDLVVKNWYANNQDKLDPRKHFFALFISGGLISLGLFVGLLNFQKNNGEVQNKDDIKIQQINLGNTN